uniref:Uncharacterized protein n=1 Tax=Ciona intestinalis TaxID=7719 RepID=H2XTR8_CIOIN
MPYFMTAYTAGNSVKYSIHMLNLRTHKHTFPYRSSRKCFYRHF